MGDELRTKAASERVHAGTKVVFHLLQMKLTWKRILLSPLSLSLLCRLTMNAS